MYEAFELTGRGMHIEGYHFPCEAPNHVVCLIHGIGEYAGRYSRIAESFKKAGIAVVSMDHRGHGRSEGTRGHCAPRAEVLKDVDALIDKAGELYPGVPIVLYGHSMGGNIAADYRARGSYNDRMAGYIISAPWIKLVMPVTKTLVRTVGFLSKIMPSFKLKAPVNEEDLGNVDYVRPYNNNPLVHPYSSALCAYEGFVIGSKLGEGTNESNGRAKDIPCLLMHGENDKICDVEGSRAFAKLHESDKLTYVEWPGYSHEIHNGGKDGRTGDEVIQRARDFVLGT